MSNSAYQSQALDLDGDTSGGYQARQTYEDPILDSGNPEKARPIPRISIQIFCADATTAEAAHSASSDRRLSKAHVSLVMGGIEAAIVHFQEAPSPNLIVVESLNDRHGLLSELDRLAERCDPGTKVVVIGHTNDVLLYRELVRRGVNEYLVAPIGPLQLMESISNLYNDPTTDPVGQVVAFIGAKGGVGSSTICHNAAFLMSQMLKSDVVITDLDLPFGTAGLDFNQDPVQGVFDALASPDRLDEVLLDRLLVKCTDHLSLFAAPGALDRNYEIDHQSFEQVLDVVRQNVPMVAVDVPHVWTPWVKNLLLTADQIVITAIPDLGNLRNAKNIVDLLKAHRKHDKLPHLVLNQVGLPKRPEIPAKEFGEALGLPVRASIEFDGETFGMAGNNGQMVEELAGKSRAAEHLRNLASLLINRVEQKAEKKRSMLMPLLGRLNRKKAGA